eukprot:6211487-Pleurochrysis_carterae.AAC.3
MYFVTIGTFEVEKVHQARVQVARGYRVKERARFEAVGGVDTVPWERSDTQEQRRNATAPGVFAIARDK